jgi:hypothetical protein
MSFEWSLLDRVGNVARVQSFATATAATATIQDLIDRWLVSGALLDDAVSSQIIGGQAIIPFTSAGGWKAAPGSTGNLNGDAIVMNFENAANQYASPILLPSYLDTFIVNGKIDLTADELAAVIADFLNAALDVDYVSRDLQALSALRDAFLADRKQRGQRSRTRTLG